MRGQPAALNDFSEGVLYMGRVEVQPKRGGCAYDALAIEGDQLAGPRRVS